MNLKDSIVNLLNQCRSQGVAATQKATSEISQLQSYIEELKSQAKKDESLRHQLEKRLAGMSHSCGAFNVHNANLTYGSMTDQEGNTYKTIVIGTQKWMAENLNTSIYRNGDAIPTGLSNSQWQNTTQGAWAYYNNDASYACPYGKLYNWYACVDARGLCPTGWHVPTDEEWTTLTTFLGGEGAAGGAMKSTGTIEAGTGLWLSPNVGATNPCGFSGLPGGCRDGMGGYSGMCIWGGSWSSTQSGSTGALNLSLSYGGEVEIRDHSVTRFGYGVRCLRD